MRDPQKDRAEFLAGLARKVVAAGALVTNEDGYVLLVRPTYKPGWEVPGGCADSGESAREACRRELVEELAWEGELGRLLVVHHEQTSEGDGIRFVYDAGVLSGGAAPVLPAAELADARFVPPSALGELLSPRKALRMQAALRARHENRLVEIVDDAVF